MHLPHPLNTDPPDLGQGVSRRQVLGTLGALLLPWDLARASSPSTAEPPPASPAPSLAANTAAMPLQPDLLNLYPIIEETARMNAPRLSYLEDRWSDLGEWQRTARPVLLDRLGYQPAVPPVVAELLRRERREGFTLEVLTLSATPAYRIPARVLVPEGPSKRRPAVVALHCHGGSFVWGHEKILSSPDDSPVLHAYRQELYGGRAWAEVLARRGYVVIVIDGFYFGSRRLQAEKLDPDLVYYLETREYYRICRTAQPGSPEWVAAANAFSYYYEHLTAKSIDATGATWPGILLWDDMRTVDYLLTRPDVDPERIGCAGLSGGGFRSALLAAADPRVKVASVTGWMPVMDQLLRNHLHYHSWMTFIPGLYRSLDTPDMVSLHAPNALLVQQCTADGLYPMPAMEAAVEKLRKIYAKAGAPERFLGSFHAVPHSFTPPMQDETFAWFDRWL
ncbi:MAG: prolyl oligopeptidase family serine peptidase [Opitutaceae bacterium]